MPSFRFVPLFAFTVVIIASCSSAAPGQNDAGSEPAPEALAMSSLDAAVTTTSAPPPKTDEQLAIVDTFVSGTEILLSQESIDLSFEGAEDGYTTKGWVEVNPLSGAFRSFETESYDGNDPIVSEYALVGDNVSGRLSYGDDAAEEWTRLNVADSRHELFDESMLFSGRAGASFDRLAMYLRELPFEQVVLDQVESDATLTAGWQIELQAADIARFLTEEKLEIVGPSTPEGSSFLEFWIDETGMLSRLSIGGIQFHDGEALDGFGGRIDYRRVPSRSIDEP